jgi:hypothetical protein
VFFIKGAYHQSISSAEFSSGVKAYLILILIGDDNCSGLIGVVVGLFDLVHHLDLFDDALEVLLEEVDEVAVTKDLDPEDEVVHPLALVFLPFPLRL